MLNYEFCYHLGVSVKNLDRKLIQTLCVCMCFFTLDFWAKARPQTMHWNGFSPVWLQETGRK